MAGPTSKPITLQNHVIGNRNNNDHSPSLQNQIMNHISLLETLIKEHNEKDGMLITPIRLTFSDEGEQGGKGNDKRKSLAEKVDEDLKKPYKEVLKSLFTRRIIEFSAPSHRMPTNLKIYDGSIDPDDHITRFVGAAKQGEWEMPRRKSSKDPTEVSKKVRKANETLPDFKERWTEEMGYIQGRVDDFVKSEEDYKSTKFPKGEHLKRGQGTPYKGACSPRIMQGGGVPKVDVYNTYNRGDLYQPYVPPRQLWQRYDNRRFKSRRQEVKQLSLEALIKRPREILATKLQLQLPPCPSMVRTTKKENLDRYYDYPGKKGHYTNECYQLKRQLEAALESGKLNHLVKDVRQREQLLLMGKIELEVMFGSEGLCRRAMMKLTVMHESSPYNIILGQTGMRELRAITSKMHAMMKFPTPRGIATLVPQTATIFECRQLEEKQTLPGKQPKERITERDENAVEEKVMVNLAFPDQKVIIRTQFSLACRKQLINLLRDNQEVFAWQPSDMAGVPRGMDQGQYCKTGEVPDLDLQPSSSEKGNLLLYQDAIRPEEHRGTYQRLVNSAFQVHLGKNLEVYVDDMVIKSKTEQEMIIDIAETFDNLRKVNMKLNPKKCSFGVKEGKFLGYMITSKGIRANPKKTRAVADM
uniref:Reverse transcriptase domain-containing protein n=1 Tax=Tanacetum cinerariifolium TaxID=118510 RepID=A0A6L2MJC3_TANCI|nr:reverse transcriptase domain-containing protein [Tanacetum cinerariifolium]